MRNYRKGRNFEYVIRDRLRAMGYMAYRLAASKPFDIIALKAGEQPLIVECKAGSKGSKLTKGQKELLAKIAEKAGTKVMFACKRQGRVKLEELPSPS